MESDINCLTESFLSQPLPSWGCLIVETHGKPIDIATVRSNVHSSLHIGVSVELQHRIVIDNYQTSFLAFHN